MSDHPAPPTTVLALAHAAAGGEAWNAVRALRCRGSVAAGGLRGPYELIVDLAGGRHVAHYTLGPATMSKGFDGRHAWQRGTSGEVLLQDAEAARAAMLTEAFVHARGYWRPGRWPAALVATAERHDDGVLHDLVTLAPAGGDPVTLWFDRATRRLVRVGQDSAGRAGFKRFDDHRPAGPLALPWRTVAGEGRHEIVIQFETVETLADVDDEAFAVPRRALEGLRIEDGQPIPIDLVNNHVYVAASIGGCALRLLLDTGGVTLLTPEAAARAGLRVEGALEARGPGAEAADAGFARAPELRIGRAAVLEAPLLRVVPLPGLAQFEGCGVDGVLGVELMERALVRIDYAARTLTLAPPGAFEPPAQARVLPLTFFAHFPCVEGVLDGHAGQFLLDTGNRHALTLWKPFVEAHEALRTLPMSEPTTIGWGVGGAVPGRFARGGRFVLGGVEIEAPELTLPSADTGFTALRGVAGNVGGGLLRRFVVTLDYAGRRAILERP